MSSKLPPLLESGSRVYVVSPSGPVVPDILSTGLDTLHKWGLEVVTDPEIYARSENGYLAGSDEVRLAAIHRALEADVDAVFFSRGGYGLTRIVDQLDLDLVDRNPRWLVGFSDITALHLAFQAHGAATTTVHGHVVKSFASQPDDLPALHALLFNGSLDATMQLEPIGEVRMPASGWATGGNLSLVCAMLDSPYCPDFEDDILFLEDVGEADYRLDRLFTMLATSRRARGVAGIVLGDFTDCDGVYINDAQFPSYLRQLGAQLADRLGCPVWRGYPTGHDTRNYPFLYGRPVSIDEEGLLTFGEGS